MVSDKQLYSVYVLYELNDWLKFCMTMGLDLVWITVLSHVFFFIFFPLKHRAQFVFINKISVSTALHISNLLKLIVRTLSPFEWKQNPSLWFSVFYPYFSTVWESHLPKHCSLCSHTVQHRAQRNTWCLCRAEFSLKDWLSFTSFSSLLFFSSL